MKYIANESMFDSFLLSTEKPDENDKKNSYGSFILVLPERLLGYRKYIIIHLLISQYHFTWKEDTIIRLIGYRKSIHPSDFIFYIRYSLN